MRLQISMFKWQRNLDPKLHFIVYHTQKIHKYFFLSSEINFIYSIEDEVVAIRVNLRHKLHRHWSAWHITETQLDFSIAWLCYFTHTHTYTYTYTYTRTCTHTYTYTETHIHTHVHTHIHRTHTYIYTHTYAHTQNTQTYTYTYAHTQLPEEESSCFQNGVCVK